MFAVTQQIGKLDFSKTPGSYYHALIRKIIGQQLSVKAAATIIKRFENLFSKKSQIKPELVLRLKASDLREVGISYQKVSYIFDLSNKIFNKELSLRGMHKMNDAEVISALTQVKGIGPWSAEMFLMFSLQRPDIFSFGDLGLRNAMIKLYGLPKTVSKKRLEKISSQWSPYRTIAARYLWASLDNQ